ncbi:hypothetical protein L7750_04735 [Xenorhabdus bovienii]|uniref:hypothetical protein n=1 Tax=Xenorhabdus bovienii TaxID=40576 RepID=UPI001EE07ADB|nr:hypothetical protein [Xenorhabdus bovienii]MCG3469726.1 hypothetical protein [Xenorhabdus bovienii]
MKGNNNLYFATEKNIYDALHHKRITTAMLQDILLRKGIIVSEHLDKEELIEEVCKLPHGFIDLQEIKKKVQTYDPKESVTKVSLTTSTNQQEVKDAINKMKDNYPKTKSEVFKVTTKKDGGLSVELHYDDIDLSRTALRQIDKKSVKLDFSISEEKIDIRMPQNSKSKELVKLIETQLSGIKNVEISRFEISLEVVTSPNLRSQFFHDLMHGLEGYEVEDVNNIEVNRFINKLSNNNDEDDDDEKIDAGYVRKAVLKGGSVNSSSIFSDLHNKGYYISKVSWASIPSSGNGDKIILEAFFKNSESCMDFAYNIKGINNFNKGKFNVTTRSVNEIEKKNIGKLIEDSAEKAYNSIINIMSGGSENEKNKVDVA